MLRKSQIKKLKGPGFITSDGRIYKRPKATVRPNQKRQPDLPAGSFVYKFKNPSNPKIHMDMLDVQGRMQSNGSGRFDMKKSKMKQKQIAKRRLRNKAKKS